jgi:DNA-binding beta-propeller fold protein YncE
MLKNASPAAFRPALPILLATTALLSQQAPREQVGPLPDGGFLLSSGWRIKPAGTQIPVGTFPIAQAITPDKKFLLVLNGGFDPPAISVIDIASAREVGRAAVPDAWLGLAISKAGDRVYVGGGSRAAVYEFKLANGILTPSRLFPVVADNARKPEDFIGDVALSPDGHLLYAADLYRESVVVVNTQSGLILSRFRTGRRPYRILFHPSGKSLYVSSWADGSIGQYDANTGQSMANTRVAPHTTDMVWLDGQVEDHPEVAARLFVSASNTNSVYVLGATESGDLSRLETINITLTPLQPLGTTPSGLGLSADGSKLFVACSDANAAAVVDVSGARSRVLGFIPAGWYPTAAFALPDGRIGVLNGKGSDASAKTGTVQFVALPGDEQMQAYSEEVRANSPYNDAKRDDPGIPAGSPIRPNGPIKHVIYVIGGNNTYDRATMPNLQKLAGDFVLLDNFYANGDTRADGHNWATAAIAPDYTQRLSPNQFAGRRQKYDFEGGEPANSPPAGYLWTNAAQAGISMGNYGEGAVWLKPAPGKEPVANVADPVLAKVTDRDYPPSDADVPDADRAKEIIGDLREFEKSGSLPQLLIVRMGNDRADSDQAIGMLIEAVSKSRFWNETAIFVIEDAARSSPDRLASHRAPAWVVSPWVKRRAVDSTMYNQMSVLRTIEIILGLHPMTTYDAGARPMFSAFGNAASSEPYTSEKARTP